MREKEVLVTHKQKKSDDIKKCEVHLISSFDCLFIEVPRPSLLSWTFERRMMKRKELILQKSTKRSLTNEIKVLKQNKAEHRHAIKMVEQEKRAYEEENAQRQPNLSMSTLYE